jgi:hypothetical protein
MRKEKIYRAIKAIIAEYEQQLQNTADEVFQTTPLIGGWSHSEVFSHIFDASLLSLMAMQKCIDKEGEIKTTPFGAQLVLFFGMFPPAKKYKVPKRLENRVKKISKMAAQQFITDFEMQLAKIYPQIETANNQIKIKHPRMGYLNTKQWFRFIEIHLAHHLKQLARIEKSFLQSI